MRSVEQFLEKHWHKAVLLCFGVFFITAIFQLTRLPVFADEAIYIRWSQLMIEDFSRYALFPLNDGKTPLQMWLMIPMLKLFANPLFAGRFLSILIGMVQLFLLQQIIRTLGGKRVAQVIGMASLLLPFWFFSHRMALIDTLLSACISLSFLGLLQLTRPIWEGKPAVQKNGKSQKEKLIAPRTVQWTLVAGIGFGLGLLTKLPALFFAPVFVWIWLLQLRFPLKVKSVVISALPFALAGLLGLVMFFSLKLHPAFSQLFGRGNDFTFSVEEVLSGQWRTSLDNTWRLVQWVAGYTSWPLLGVLLVAAARGIKQKKNWLLMGSAVLFCLPLLMFGRVLFPRYFLPIMIFVSVGAALASEAGLQAKQQIWKIFTGGILIIQLLISLRFMSVAYLAPDQLPLVPIDREQYLEEWSSGHGVAELIPIIQAQSVDHRVLVLSEGYFGTLPDGLLMYFFQQDVDNLEIVGIGAPVREITAETTAKMTAADEVLLVVNSHRMFLPKEEWELVQEFPRPSNAPSLQLYRWRTSQDSETVVK